MWVSDGPPPGPGDRWRMTFYPQPSKLGQQLLPRDGCQLGDKRSAASGKRAGRLLPG